MKEYCLGFVFNTEGSHVILIRKNRPKWQAGYLNGIGGHIEPGETGAEAMAREFEEETGVKLPINRWEHFCTLGDGKKFSIKVFRAFAIKEEIGSISSTTDEVVGLYPTDFLSKIHLTIPNLAWLIPMALYMDLDSARGFYITESNMALEDTARQLEQVAA